MFRNQWALIVAPVLMLTLSACGNPTGEQLATDTPLHLNSMPEANSASVDGLEDEVLTGKLAGSDEELSKLTIEITGKPAHGKIALAATGTFDYTPEPDWNGQDEFTFRVSDGTDWSDEAKIEITIAPVNDLPTLTTASLTGLPYVAGSPVSVMAAGWADVDGDPTGYLYRWTVDGASVPVYGSALPATYVTKGKILQAFITPFDGTAAGVEVASDTVTVGNTAPVAAADAFEVVKNSALTQSFLGSDIDADVLSYEIVSSPAHGAVTFPAAGSYTYTPDTDWFGSDSFSYRVSDGTAWSNTAVVQATVNAQYAVPIIPGPLPDVACDTSGTFTITAITPDPAVRLTPGSVVTFTATVRYSTTVVDSLRLSMVSNGFTTITAPIGEAVALAPVVGCAETSVTFSNVTIPSDTGSVFLQPVAANAGSPKGSGVLYLTKSPSIRIAATDQDPTQPLLLSADGTATLNLKYTWENIPENPAWQGMLTTDGSNFINFSLPATAGSGIYTVTTRPLNCNTHILLVHAGGYPASGTGQVDQWIQRWMEIPSLLGVYTNSALQTLQGTVNRTITVRNCSTTTQYVTVSSSDAWIYPMAVSTSIAPAASANVTFATDIRSLATGMYNGHVSVAPVDATANTLVLPFRLSVPSTQPYAAVATTYSWYTETAAAVQLATTGEDEAIHAVDLPFPFTMYGVAFTQASVMTNGYIRFDQPASSEWSPAAIPTTKAPWSILAQWADLLVEPGQTITTELVGTAPNRQFVVTWNGISDYGNVSKIRTAQVILIEGSDGFLVQYAEVNSGAVYGINVGDGTLGTSWAAANGSAFWVSPN